MKREIKIHQVNAITGEIYMTSDKQYNYDIPEHKKRFIEMCEAFYNKHFSNPLVSCELYIYFPANRSELELPF